MITLKAKLYYPVFVPMFITFFLLLLYGLDTNFESEFVDYMVTTVVFIPLLVLMYFMPRTSVISLNKDDIYVKKWDLIGYGQSEFNILWKNVRKVDYDHRRYTCIIHKNDGSELIFDVRFLVFDRKKIRAEDACKLIVKYYRNSPSRN